jgi:hypothetical protein|tara:strand:+ start:94 stop:393 length:300 start_codon:yes stop_codon:yes gene_type:complete
MTVNVNYPLPTVHLNGTSQAKLLKDAKKLHDALNEAYSLVCRATQDCEFHGRDYYVQDPPNEAPSAFTKAQKERLNHMSNLIAFRQYALEHVMHLENCK